MEDKRDFTRYSCKSECEITIDGEAFQGFIVDYSDGLGIITGKNPLLKNGATADINMLHSGEEISGEVVWLKEVGADMRVGIKRIGNLKGNLKNFKHVDLLIGLQRGTKTGTLEVVNGSIVKKIYIKNGDMIFASSNMIDERLGERLVKKGSITVEQFNLATQRLLETGEKLGKILVDMSCLTPHELYHEVRNQVEEIILSIFDLEEGDFEFREGSLSEENLVTLVISAANIIYRGMKRINSYHYIKQIFPFPEDVLDLSQQPMNIHQSISLNDTDEQILQAISGSESVKKLLSLFPDNDFETLKTISAFLSIGIITIKKQDEAPAEVLVSDILNEQDDTSPEEFLAAVDELYARCELADYYDFLGIDRQAGEQEIQWSYYSISKRFHPDRHFAFQALDIKGKLIKIFSYATEANNVLADPDRKEKYDTRLLSNTQNGLHEKETGDTPHEKINVANEGLIQGPGIDGSISDSNESRIGNEQEIEEAIVAPYDMGISYMEMGLMEEAIHEFRNAMNVTSEKARSTKMIAECYIWLGNNQKAIDEMKKVMSEISSDKQEYMDMKYELADVYIKSKEYKDALKLLDEIKSEDPEFRDVPTKIETVSNLLSSG